MTRAGQVTIFPGMDIVELREFYASRMGNATRRMIAERLPPIGVLGPGSCIMGLGYAVPYLPQESEASVLAFMPARQGVVRWPDQHPSASALVDEFDLPLLESVVDVALVIHALELSDNPADMLAEIWRVLSPQGRLCLVVPNRRGLWANFESSPFGHGQPFSRSQLSRLLKGAKFTAVSWSQALYMPPINRKWALSTASGLERMGNWLMPRFSGVIMVEAVKQVYAFSSGKRARRLVPRFKPVLLPAPSSASKT
jgi:SAM-dependent methyltransferase